MTIVVQATEVNKGNLIYPQYDDIILEQKQQFPSLLLLGYRYYH